MIKIILLLVIVDMNFCESLTLSKGLNKKITIKPKKRIELNQNKYVLKGTNYIKQEVYVWKEKDYNQSYVFESMNKSIPIDTLKFNSITYFKVDNARRLNLGCFFGVIPIGLFLQLEKQNVNKIINSLNNTYRYPRILIILIPYHIITNPETSMMGIASMTIGGTIGLIGAKVRKKLKSKEGVVSSNGWNIVPN